MIRLLSLLALAAPATAWAGPKREAVMDLLNAFEDPIQRADLAALGEGVDAELMEIADDLAIPTSRRGRAISGLQYYETERVRAFLEQKLASISGESLLRRKAAMSLAAFGPAALPALGSALRDGDVQVRIAVAQALGKVGGDAAQKLLREQLAAEAEPAVKEAIARSLGVKP